MGLFGDILGGIAGAVVKGISESNYKEKRLVSIILNTDNIYGLSDADIRNSLVQGLIATVGDYMNLPIDMKTLNVFWRPFIDSSGGTGDYWDGFVVSSGSLCVKFGLVGFGQFGIQFEGARAGELALALKEPLEDFKFNNLSYNDVRLPFHEAEWMEETVQILASNLEEYLNDENDSSSDDDYEDDDDYDDDSDAESIIVEGDARLGSKLLKLYGSIITTDFDDLFSECNSVDFVRESEKGPYFVSDDGAYKLSFEFGDDYIETGSGGATFRYTAEDSEYFFLFYASEKEGSKLFLIYDDKDRSVVFRAEHPDGSFDVENMLEELEDEDVFVPEDFAENLHTFFVKLVRIGIGYLNR